MNRLKLQKLTRKWHRLLGLIIGVQLMFWCLGGIIFTWIHLDNIHGDYESKLPESPSISVDYNSVVFDSIINNTTLSDVVEVKMGMFLNAPVVKLIARDESVEMFNAATGQKLSPITKEQARIVAIDDFIDGYDITAITLVDEHVGEYKGPIPAWRVDFNHWKNNHIYISAQTGLVSARRHKLWRLFDFFWMLHIMDYVERDNFNNWPIRIASVLGLLTVLSGYLLWGVTTPIFRKKV